MQTLCTEYFKIPETKLHNSCIAMRLIAGWCKSACCNVHEGSVTRQAGGGIAIIVLKIVNTSHHTELEMN
jgi:hypothetical protein